MKTRAYYVFLVLLLAPLCSHATYITMATEFTISEKTNGLQISVSSQNLGDEAAFGVQVEVSVGSKNFTSSSIQQLGVNETIFEEFPIHDAFDQSGHYPIIIKTYYKDANAYPFTALAVGFYDYLNPVVSKILIRAEGIDIPSNGKGKLEFIVRNNDVVSRDLDISFHLPDELAVVEEDRQLTVGPRKEETLQFTVENFSALEDSGYAVVLVAQYEDGENHYSSAGSVVVRIVAPVAISPIAIGALLAFLAALVALVIFVRSRRK